MDTYFIPVIAGTTRPKRKSIVAAEFIYELLKQRKDITTELVDPDNFDLPFDGNDPENKDPRYSKITKEADGFIIVVPEYNHSFPGSLKRLLDSELENYNHKPVALAGVSAGPWGGVRAVESLVPAVREMGLVVTSVDAYFPSINSLIDDSGTFIDDDKKYEKRVTKMVEELLWLAQLLKWGRKNMAK